MILEKSFRRTDDEWDRRVACHGTECIELPDSASCIEVPVRSFDCLLILKTLAFLLISRDQKFNCLTYG